MKRLLLLLVLCGLGLAGIGYWLSSSGRANGPTYHTEPVQFDSLTEIINATGLIAPRETFVVVSKVPGEVVRIYPEADFNKPVQKGQPLVELDSEPARFKVEDAEAAVQLAQADVKRAQAAREAAQSAYDIRKKFREREAAGAEEAYIEATKTLGMADAALKVARDKVKQADVGLRAARKALDYTTIRAPADGVIIDKKVLLGQPVGPQLATPLFTIAGDLARVQVNAQIQEGDVGRVRVGLPASFTVYAYSDGGDRFDGKIEQFRLTPTSMPGPVQGAVFYTAVIDAANRPDPAVKGDKQWMLRPGMTATIDIRRREHANVWKVPTAALNLQFEDKYWPKDAHERIEAVEAKLKTDGSFDDWKRIWILKDGKPSPVYIRTGGKGKNGETGINSGNFVEVLEWEPGFTPNPVPQVIDSVTIPTRGGLFDIGNKPLKFA